MDSVPATHRGSSFDSSPPLHRDRLHLWLPLLRRLTERVPEWLVYKNATSTLYGAGDVDGLGRRRVWPTITAEFLVWATERRLGPVVICNHIPPVLFLIAVPDDSETFLQMDVSDGRLWRGSRLFEVEDTRGLAEMDELGFRRLRPGAEGLFKFAFNGIGWSGRPNWGALQAKGTLEQLREDPEGVRRAAQISGLSSWLALRSVRAALDGSWDYPATHALQAMSAVRALRHPAALARRLGQTFRIRRGAEICEILTPMLRDGRRIPRDRAAWLDALSRSHQVIAAKPTLASVGPPRSAGP